MDIINNMFARAYKYAHMNCDVILHNKLHGGQRARGGAYSIVIQSDCDQ